MSSKRARERAVGECVRARCCGWRRNSKCGSPVLNGEQEDDVDSVDDHEDTRLKKVNRL